MNTLTTLAENPFYVRLILSALILLIFIIAKRFLIKFLLKCLSKISIKGKQVDTSLFDRLHKPLNQIILLTGLYVALSISPFTYSSPTNVQVLSIGELSITMSIIKQALLTKLYAAIIVALLTQVIYNLEIIYEELFSQFNSRLSLIDNTLIIRYISRIIRFVTAGIGACLVFLILIPEIGSIITGLGIGGAALALIFKDTIADIFSGMILLLDKPFVIGDWVELSGIEGIVEDISFRSTRIRTFTQGQVVIPNATVGGENIINWSSMSKRRAKFNIGLVYGTTSDKLEEYIREIKSYLSSNKDIESDSYLVAFENFGEYSLNIEVIYFSLKTDYPSYLAIKEEVNFKLMGISEKVNVEMAFPTQTLFVENSNC